MVENAGDDASLSSNWLEDLVLTLLTNLENFAKKDFGPETLIVIDSLNALTDLLSSINDEAESKLEPRTAMRMISNAARLWAETKSIILFLGEYHPNTSLPRGLESESFLCDVEILLAPETVAGTNRTPLDSVSQLGYVMERQLSDRANLTSTLSQAIEIRSFCRVLKSRNTFSQSRRCTYDIVPIEGIRFYPTYPGDGSVLLFAENAPQSKFWDEFIFNELPYTHPALRYERFDRKGLQRIFATQRQWRQIPGRTDMYVSNFDSYWIKWYSELTQRFLLRELIRQKLEPLSQCLANAAFAELLCRLTRLTREIIGEANRDEELYLNKAKEFTSSLIDRLSRLITAALRIVDGRGEISESELQEIMREPSVAFVRIDDRRGEAYFERFKLGVEQCLKDFTGTPPALRGNQIKVASERIINEILGHASKGQNVLGANQGDFLSNAKGLLREAYSQVSSDEFKSGILHAVPQDRIRLYGERQSELIPQIDRRPAGWAGEKHLSVPYNANISFLVFRKRKNRLNLDEFSKAIGDLCATEYSALRGFQLAHISDGRIPVPTTEQIGSYLESRDDAVLLSTWEGLMVCCRGDHFLIETQTFDTFLCTFLEIFWSYGGELSIDEEYSVHDENRVKQALFQAFWILREMFKNGLIPKDSTLDAGVFGRRFGQADKTGASAGGSWMCARHWYSSFIDVLTARNSDEASDWAWKPEASQALEVLQIPTSIQQIVFAKLEGREVMHHSCWGDWHLGVLKSSENVDLAIEILNNIMSSHKICEGAFRCAFVPTVEQFYKTYGTAKCFNVPERGPLIKTPNLTFTGLRDGFMKNARNRSEKMFDYRHCMRELHSVLTLVHNNSDIGDEELGREVIQVVGRIKELKYQALLLH